jgi:hypothetical protein
MLLLIDIAVVIAITKFLMLFKQGPLATLHEARADFSMLFRLIAILPVRAGMFSLEGRRNQAIRI